MNYDQHDNPMSLQTMVEGGIPYQAETPARAYNNRTLSSEAFEAAYGRAMRDHNPDDHTALALYKACAEGWQAGYEYGQQS